MKSILDFREGDARIIQGHLEKLRNYSDEKLVEAYNKEARKGILNIRAQTLYLYCLRIVLRERFNSSPIYKTEDNIVGMQGEVRLVDGKLWFK